MPVTGDLRIYQDPAIDSLIGRYILYNIRLNGLEGFRIQIYNSSAKNAREESGRKRAEFMSRFPGIASYATFDRPSYYKIRVRRLQIQDRGYKVPADDTEGFSGCLSWCLTSLTSRTRIKNNHER